MSHEEKRKCVTCQGVWSVTVHENLGECPHCGLLSTQRTVCPDCAAKDEWLGKEILATRRWCARYEEAFTELTALRAENAKLRKVLDLLKDFRTKLDTISDEVRAQGLPSPDEIIHITNRSGNALDEFIDEYDALLAETEEDVPDPPNCSGHSGGGAV